MVKLCKYVYYGCPLKVNQRKETSYTYLKFYLAIKPNKITTHQRSLFLNNWKDKDITEMAGASVRTTPGGDATCVGMLPCQGVTMRPLWSPCKTACNFHFWKMGWGTKKLILCEHRVSLMNNLDTLFLKNDRI